MFSLINVLESFYFALLITINNTNLYTMKLKVWPLVLNTVHWKIDTDVFFVNDRDHLWIWTQWEERSRKIVIVKVQYIHTWISQNKHSVTLYNYHVQAKIYVEGLSFSIKQWWQGDGTVLPGLKKVLVWVSATHGGSQQPVTQVWEMRCALQDWLYSCQQLLHLNLI